jgi:hypothetical protein
MPADRSLRALREASPRSQAGFGEWLDRLDPLREQIPAAPGHAGLWQEGTAHVRAPAGTTRQVPRWRRRLLSLCSVIPCRPAWLAAGAAGAAIAAGLALVVAALVPGSGGSTDAAQLTAWTVTRQADGNIAVTIRQLKDPAGLQATLRADGVPASVTFTRQQNPACRPYPGGTQGTAPHRTPLPDRVFPRPKDLPRPPAHPRQSRATIDSRGHPPGPSAHAALIVIDPSALPGNAGVQIAVSDTGPRGPVQVDFPTVVYASPQCTGA